MSWKNLALAAFGISIPAVTYALTFVLHLPGPIYFLAASPIYIVYVLISAKRKGRPAKKIVGIAGALGFAIAFLFSVLSLFPDTVFTGGFPLALEECMIGLFPSSIFWMALDTPGGHPPMGAVVGVYSAAIIVNVILYAVLGCVLYYLKNLRPKKMAPA